ncbi:MAG: OmpA family protein [Candidatus Latescibacterota bacterium]|nr:MAG: OmpA family protein [Candidatus Latescibacterota bacterium]
MRKLIGACLVLSLAFGAIGCTMSKAQKGAVIGGSGGALIGGIVGKRAGNTAAGAIVGAAVGGATGAIIGNYMDKQAEEMEKNLEGAEVQRVGEGILVTFESGILFDVNKADLRAQARENLDKMANILNEYKDTDIRVEGHTDSDGSEEYNQTLSERRAQSVANYLGEHMVAPSRMTVVGFGEMRPVAENASPEGKQANRRVEVAIVANEELKESAAEQANEG